MTPGNETDRNKPYSVLQEKTIADFGDQWTSFKINEGYYASTEYLRDILGPLLSLSEINGTMVADIGSGTGRIVQMLLSAGARHVFATEPSRAVHVLRANLSHWGPKVTILEQAGEALSSQLNLDFVFCIGVLHHIPSPHQTLVAARAALNPNGKFVLWVYGGEKGGALLDLIRLLRIFTRKMPDRLLWFICKRLRPILEIYIKMAQIINVPLRDYARNVLSKLDPKTLELSIYDQLNPTYTKYYTRTELDELLAKAGFKTVKYYHRHAYSWTVVANV